MKYCTNCGAQNDANTNFCSSCGQSLNQNVGMAQVNGIVGTSKPKNGKAIASMVLGIIAAIWALMSLASIGNIEEALVEAFAENNLTDEFAGNFGFFIGSNLLSLPCGIIGLILGLVAKPKNGKAITGIITSIAALLVTAISLVIIMNVAV